MHDHSHQQGFTLIELLTVIAVIMIMTAMVLGGTRGWQRESELEKAAADVISTYREARQYATAIRKHGDDYPSYGVHLEEGDSTVILYSDCKPDDTGEGSLTDADVFDYPNISGSNSECDEGIIITEFELVNVEVREIRFTDTSSNDETLARFSTLFLRPEPTIWFTGGSSSGSMDILEVGDVEIELENTKSTGDTKTVYINTNGFISTR